MKKRTLCFLGEDFISMSSYELSFGLFGKEAAIVLLFLINRLLLLRYVLVVGHQSITTAVPEMEIMIMLLPCPIVS